MHVKEDIKQMERSRQRQADILDIDCMLTSDRKGMKGWRRRREVSKHRWRMLRVSNSRSCVCVYREKEKREYVRRIDKGKDR